MFDIDKILEEKGLNYDTYEQLLDECQSKTHREKDIDWSEISERYNLGWSGDAIRKSSQMPITGGTFVKEYYEQKMAKNGVFSEDEYFAKLDEKKRELEREKIKYRDARNAWQKQNYSAARLETTLSILEDELKEIGKINFDVFPTPVIDGNKEMIITLADLHIGQTFNSAFGEYNADIAKDRLNQYLNKIIEVGELHRVKNVNVVNLADVISGSIHKSIAITNKENVVQQIKLATEYIANFCYELTKKFEKVKYYAITGNHERMDKKDDALHDERYGDIVNWAVSIALHHINNFYYFSHRNIDTGIVDINVLGKTYIGVHGDYDPMTKQGVANLSMFLGFVPYAILRGHLHYSAMNELNGVKVVQSGSLTGAGDSYTIEHRLTGKPSQTLLVCDENGIDCIYNVELK